MAEFTIKDLSSVERALGIIEGVACGVDERASSMLYTAIEIIDAVLIKQEGG